MDLKYFINNLQKINDVANYICQHKHELGNTCAIYDCTPYDIEDYIYSGIGTLYFLNYNLSKIGDIIPQEVLDFVEYFEDNELIIEFKWEADGHYEGRYIRGDYYNPPEYPEFVFDYFRLLNVEVKNQAGEILLTIPKEYYPVILDFIDTSVIENCIEEDKSDID